MIGKCTCKNEVQDKMYGPQMRVFNPLKRDKNSPIRGRCSICGKVQDFGKAEVSKEASEKEKPTTADKEKPTSVKVDNKDKKKRK